jgi:hypothetical protein
MLEAGRNFAAQLRTDEAQIFKRGDSEILIFSQPKIISKKYCNQFGI